MERPAVAARLQFRIGAAGIFQGAILGDQDEGVQCAVARGDACQRIARKRLGCDGTGPQQAAHLDDGEVLRVHHLSPRTEHIGRFRLWPVAAVQQCDLAAQIGIGDECRGTTLRRNGDAGARHQAVELGCQRVRGWGFGHVGSSPV